MSEVQEQEWAYSEADIQAAIQAFQNEEHQSIRAAARAFSVPYHTLRHRLAGRTSRSHSHESAQILSNAEEQTLVRWISRLCRTGFPASPKLVVEMAEEVRRSRCQLSQSPPSALRPIGEHWIDRFRTRHPEIKGTWTRQIESARHAAVNTDTVKTWFDAVTELRIQHHYPPECIYNMDESGFAVGTSQSSRVLVNVREQSSWKVISGRQEWITAIECISAAGVAIPPLVIFKAKHTNTRWIPADTPPEWRFSTSNSGWTSDSHAFEWLSSVFEPFTRPVNPTQRRLLIMDGHSSHITANVIAHCMEHAIDLLILPPHTSHVLQPLDVSVFSPLKRALAMETDAALRLDPGRITRSEWTAMYIRARENALRASNITSGWRATGLWPLSPISVLEKLPTQLASQALEPHTTTPLLGLDLSLLQSDPPDGTELREANTLCLAAVNSATDLATPAKRYISRLTQAAELLCSKNATLRTELAKQRDILQTRKNRNTGKRVALKGKFVFSTQEVLEVAREAEKATASKTSRKRPRKQPAPVEIGEQENEVLENVSSNSDSDCIAVVPRRSS
jgi:hypothetical protein